MNNIQKRWNRHYDRGYSVAYWVDIEKPVIIFDSRANTVVKYAELSIEEQNMIDTAVDEFEEPFNSVVLLGSIYYERLNYNRFSLLREIKEFGESFYNISDFKEGCKK